MNKLREFVYKYKITCAIVLLFVSSLSIYYFAFAEDDPYEDQTEVKSTSVTIESGTNVNTGLCDGKTKEEIITSGIDCAIDDDIVRNFDEIIYNISYKLEYKPNISGDVGITRTVLVDVLLPSDLSVTVSEGEATAGTIDQNPDDLTIGGKEYTLYQFELKEIPLIEPQNVIIRLSRINSIAGYIINPIIRVREKTDTNIKEITNNTNLETLEKVNVSPVSVSAKEQYGIKLYQGSSNKSENQMTVPIGVLIYIPKNNDGDIKGVQIPKEVKFDVNVVADGGDSKLTNEAPKISDYDPDKGLVNGLPKSYENENGNAGIADDYSLNKLNGENTYKSVIPVRITNLKYHGETVDLNNDTENQNIVTYISSKMLIIKTERQNNKKSDVNYTVTYPNGSGKNEEFSFIDNYTPYPGDYHTKIDFYKSNVVDGIQDSPTFNEKGKAIYNYGEEFNIQNTIIYGENNLGDSLNDGFTNYIKIDNSAIKILKLDENRNYFVSVNAHNKDENINESDITVEYGIGDWNKDNFELTDVAGCPTDINALTKDELMNYYGGQCIKEKSGKITWRSDDEITDEEWDKIIVVKVKTKHSYNLGAETIVRLRAQAVNNPSNIGSKFQVVSCGQTKWNGKTHYLSPQPRESVLFLDYTKESNQEHGNTVLISPFKASINSIRVEDVYGSERNEIYSGMNDPMEIIINPVIFKSNSDATIINSKVKVFLPKTLELQIRNGDKVPSNYSNPESDADNNIYIYEYSESDINFDSDSAAGTIPNLKIHANIKIDTVDSTSAAIKATIFGTLKPNTDAITTYSDVTSLEERTKEIQISLRNSREVNSVGKVNTLYIDKNKSYIYNMRSVNLSDESKIELLNILPFTGDSVGEGSKFSGNISVSINELPQGYTAKYTTTDPKTILSSELNGNQINWESWDYTKSVQATAIKIESENNILKGQYFGSENGINITINTSSNQEMDIYSNKFYMLKRNADICVDLETLTGECRSAEKGTASYSSNISYVSVYNRTISGMVFEDLDFDGFSDNEKRIKDIPVELYSLSKTDFDSKKPSLSISDSDKLIDESITDRRGRYSFKDLPSGNYYVKYIIDCEKYTVTHKNKQDPTVQGDTSLKDSDAEIVTVKATSTEKDSKAPVCYAVSNIVTLDRVNVAENNIDLGIRPKQEFDIKLKKYITRIDVNSSSGNKTYKYNNVTKVNFDIRNLKNTTFRVSYGIEVENSKFFPGTIGNIIETIPEGMTFNPNLPENDGWYESNGLLYYSRLNKTIIRPGEKYHLTIVLDLATDSGGDYVNFVAANDLELMPVTTDFTEIKNFGSDKQNSKGGEE